MADKIFIQVRHKEYIQELGIEWQDAQYFTEEEYGNINQKEIAAEKQRRIDNFIESVKNPPPPVEETKEELEERKVALEKYIQDVQFEIQELEVKISEKTGKLGIDG